MARIHRHNKRIKPEPGPQIETEDQKNEQIPEDGDPPKHKNTKKIGQWGPQPHGARGKGGSPTP